MKRKRNLYIDGTTEDGLLTGDGNKAPFAVFDADVGDWITGGLPWRWLAVIIKWWLE